MKADRTLLFVALFANLLWVGPQPTYGQNGSVGIAFPASGITVDGDLKDWPAGLTEYPIERIEFGDKPGGKADLQAHFRIAFNRDERALYVAVEVDDDSSVLDKPGEINWDTQDGCELYINAVHDSASSNTQYARYGNQNRTYGASETAEKAMKVAVVRTDAKIVYEWRIDLGEKLDADRVIGFDVSIADRDKDGSFSWAAWGPGTQKLDVPDRTGEFYLVSPDTKFGDVSGKIAWKDESKTPLPTRVRIQSTRSEPLWRAAIVDSTGAYKATQIPVGPYSIHAIDSADLRVDVKPHTDIQIDAEHLAKADLLHVTPIPWPGLIGAKGVLRDSEELNTAELDRFAKAYMDYYKIPGMSFAAIKDFKVVYHNGYGVKNTATKDAVTDDTVFEAASMTKPLFAYMVLRLADRGVLKLDTPLYTYMPYEDIAYDDRYKLITARMVFTHRTGFPNWRTGKLDIKFTPGTKVSYSGEGFVYLGKVVEHLTSKTLVELINEEVFTPLGIENASLVWNDTIEKLTSNGHNGVSPLAKGKPSHPNVAASLHVNAKNYARFLIAALQGKGLSEETARDMLKSQVKNDEPGTSWGLALSMEETPLGTNYGHGGRNTGFTSRSLLYKPQGYGYVFLVNNDDAMKMDNVLNAYLLAGESGLKKPNAK